MRKAAFQSTTLYTFARRADLTISAHTADFLTALLLRKEALRRKWQDKDFRQELVDYGILGIMSLATGALFSLITTWLIG